MEAGKQLSSPQSGLVCLFLKQSHSRLGNKGSLHGLFMQQSRFDPQICGARFLHPFAIHSPHFSLICRTLLILYPKFAGSLYASKERTYIIVQKMKGYYKGFLQQMTPELVENSVNSGNGANKIVYSSISELDMKLDTSQFHISMPLRGRELYNVDGKNHSAEVGEYFIFNPKQEVRATGIFKDNVEGVCIFISEKTIYQAAQGIDNKIDKTLDSPFDYPWQQREFLVKNYRLQENFFGNYLSQLPQNFWLPSVDILVDWEAFYFDLASAFIKGHLQIGGHLASIPAIRTLTKHEVYRRLSLAYCHILENFAEPFSLEDLEKVSFFSKYHILRLYRYIYRMTPYQHVLQLRIEKAKILLLNSYSPSDVAMQLSFADRRSFSKVFRKMVGVPPSEFRR
ncbi:MAG: helix-turn-helix transcriptional regulator [Saprospiraceae bacterium]|nr:helix-turn-helix transcriptional regulator [Saprospiraceae bacterium]